MSQFHHNLIKKKQKQTHNVFLYSQNDALHRNMTPEAERTAILELLDKVYQNEASLKTSEISTLMASLC